MRADHFPFLTLCFMLFTAPPPLVGGPVDFGKSEVARSLKDRGIATSSLPATSLVDGKSECYSVTRNSITGSDERGLMYGLLTAADQIRATGQFTAASGCPSVAMRGIRYFLHNHDLEVKWYYSRDYWEKYFTMLAHDRFNRFNLVFAHQTNYLAPPYPFWLSLPEFPEIGVPGLSDSDRRKNLEMLQYISQAAADHGIDFTLGVWEHNAQTRPHKMVPTTRGITQENIGPYSYAALKKVLQLCPAISSVQMRTNEESGIPNDFRVQFYRDYVYKAIHDAGRPVYLDLRAWAVAKEMIDIGERQGLKVRTSTKYWAEDIGRPYQPAETFPGYSYSNFLEKPHTYQFYWELWGLGSHRLLLWGNPDYVRRAASTFSLGDAVGFEIDPPLAQKGFGNAPGEWNVFTPAQKDRIFWKWEFERYWMFYQLWGRLTYNPSEPDVLWMGELQRRFGTAASDVLEAYKHSSGVVNEIVAAHLADPNMYIWPEINPGGLIDAYRDVLPSDWRYIASIDEGVQNRIHHVASAKQTAPETAAILNGLAARTERAIARAGKKISAKNAEWQSSKADFEVLALMARYHALKQTAVDQVTYFDATGDRAALDSAARDLQSAVQVWERLVHLTDGLYPERMAFGPDDIGHWKDKLPYVRHDVELVKERAATFDGFGRFDRAFDFGGKVQVQPNPAAYRANAAILANTVEPRFLAVDETTSWSEAQGYGWASAGERHSNAIPLTPYLEMRAAARDPKDLPHDVLYRDYIQGKGAQIFRVKVEPGDYAVRFLHPDRSEVTANLKSEGAVLNIVFPEGEWSVAGLVIQGAGSKRPLAARQFHKILPRPAIAHEVPANLQAGKPLTMKLNINSATAATRIRLYYRPVNQLAKFKMMEHAPGEPTFTIPGEDVSANFDLMYYFEILNAVGGGWFQPDPLTATPYYVARVH